MAHDTLSVTLHGLDETNQKGYQMTAVTRDMPEIVLDAPSNLGNDAGYGPLELQLAALASCAAMTVASSLRKKKDRRIGSVNVEASGTLRDTPPITFSDIALHFEFVSTDATPDEIQHAIDMAESKLCPVWALLKGNVQVKATFDIQ